MTPDHIMRSSSIMACCESTVPNNAITSSDPVPSSKMQYPLQEKIGTPELLVGREKEFKNFGKWIANIPKKLSKSRVILARRKSGKTAFIQRIFNQLWSANGTVIPFYFDISENKVWYPTFAMDYYRSFATQYISYMERDPSLIGTLLSLEELGVYGKRNGIEPLLRDIDSMLQDKAAGMHDLVWKTAYSAPHRFADFYDRRFLVIIDEFQNITQYVYPDPHYQTAPIESLAGSFHYHVESKIAPMLVTGSYVRWLINISSKYLEAGRLTEMFISPYLTQESGLQAVYRYADAYGEPITNDTAVQINTLCMSDPFFISCVIQSNFEEKNLITEEGVVNTVNYEITNRYSEMSRTWGEYIQLTLQKINDRHAKNMLLFLSKHSDRYWTPKELKETMELDLEIREIQEKLLTLVEADMLEWGNADIDFRGLQDGTLNLILRNRFEKEIHNFEPDLKQEFHAQIRALKQEKQKIQGMLSNLTGQVAEMQLSNAFRSKKRFVLSYFFPSSVDIIETDTLDKYYSNSTIQEALKTPLNIVDVKTRLIFQREDGKNLEIDIVAESACGCIILVEVKKQAAKTGIAVIEDFHEKVVAYQKQRPDNRIIPAFLSLGGFTESALDLCIEKSIVVNDKIINF
ncbi:conserved hypothetical protein [Desulfamplus magnetovallimortis]|uniref:ATPase domain protein, prokaryote domain protein n=1 Tax=Desulfamplus magnetovallimortis TaxID=1246637 RepID=A0A1W1HC89_9BACT|nr:hypothetical protein [Desulfamplus magnetovallimortis]SLM30069.1 conserved hypothetical protein [Desulfamplus magnetovallimortis]